MAYDKYLSEKVFTDNDANIICNIIMHELEKEFTAPTLNADFAVTGSVAKIIQGDPNVEVKGIAFAVSDKTIYAFIKDNISTFIKTTGMILMSDRLLISTEKLNIEFWDRSGSITLVNTNGIYVEDKTQIPAYII